MCLAGSCDESSSGTCRSAPSRFRLYTATVPSRSPTATRLGMSAENASAVAPLAVKIARSGNYCGGFG
jgi:hypothetical protein